jgi:hypothetical protein
LIGVKRAVATSLLALVALLFAASAQAATLQSIGNFAEPIYVTSDPGNANRLFVVQRAGQIIQVENGAVTEFADLRSLVGKFSGEQGLLSIALAPDFDSSGRLYVDYAGEAEGGAIHVAELHAIGATVPLSTLNMLLTIPHPGDTNHYGGQLQLGPEGFLYISTGDGGGANDVHENAQDTSSLLGKILRIAPAPIAGFPASVPAGNPIPGSPVFSWGLRNPYRFSFDRLTHDMVIGDVGQSAREEIDWAPAPGLGVGANYGWNCREGTIAGPATDPGCTPAPPPGTFTEPVFDYPHENPGNGGAFGVAIIGGYVVRDPSLGPLYGRYLYGDLNGGIRSLMLSAPTATDRSENLSVPNLNSFGEDACGRLYAVSGNGPVYRLVGAAPANCATATPPAAKPLAASTIGIRAVTRRVKHNGRAQISVWVSPCNGRRGEPVRLLRGKAKLGKRRLDRACTARFLPRVTHRVRFRAEIAADSTYAAAASRALAVHVYHPKGKAKKPGARLHIPAGVGRR